MNDIPPKHTPEKPYGTPEASDGLVAVYNAASHASAESFPVLKAFQDYIEAERVQARRRVVQLSVFFTVLMGVVVAGFLTVGMFMLRNMSEVQAKLLDVALASKESPPAPQPIVMPAPAEPTPDPKPFFEASVREISKAAAELRTSFDKKMDGVSDIATKMHDRVAAQDSELGKLRETLKIMQVQSENLNKSWFPQNAPKRHRPPHPRRSSDCAAGSGQQAGNRHRAPPLKSDSRTGGLPSPTNRESNGRETFPCRERSSGGAAPDVKPPRAEGGWPLRFRLR